MASKRTSKGDMAMPLAILAGSDRRPVELPAAGRSQQPLSGYKAVSLRVGERSLVEHLIDRIRDSRAFDPVYVVGPARLHHAMDARAAIIDSDGSIGQNIRAGVEALRRAHPGSRLAFISCDVLPSGEVLARIMRRYHDAGPCDAFFPLVGIPIEAEQRLGASAWKPRYPIVPESGAKPVAVLPGHLVIADPDAIRLPFLYRLLDLSYRTRNRSLEYRLNVVIRKILWGLLYEDLRHLLDLRVPTFTLTVAVTAVAVARGLGRGTLTREQLERAVRRVFVTARHRRRHPERRVYLPIIKELSLAQDIDTVEEALAMGLELDGDTHLANEPAENQIRKRGADR